MPLKLYLVRHGETPYNVEARYQGHQDSPLTPRGREQARRLRQRLASLRVVAAYSSDLRRARQTLQLALAGRQVPRSFSPLWREVSYGRWEGLTYDEVKARWPAEQQARYRTPESAAPSGGENMSDLRERVLQGVQAIQGEHRGGAVLVVSHGGPLRVLLCHLLGLGPDSFWRLRLDTCGVSVVELYRSSAVVSLLNDTGHLDGLYTPERNRFLRRPKTRAGR
jgi:alpha-ribazole phosphatase